MPADVFFVGAQDENKKFSGYVSAKFMTIDGVPVVDPLAGGSQEPFIYADDRGSVRTKGQLANPNNFLIVPANFSEQQARDYAACISSIKNIPGIGYPLALTKLARDFRPGGAEDLQRDPQWGIPEGGFVPAFRSSASHYLGFVNGLTGIPLELSEIGGGVTNFGNTDTSGPHGISQRNYRNLVKGSADAIAVPSPLWLTNNFDFGSQRDALSNKVGDGNGVANWTTSQGDINPVYPAQKVFQPGDGTGRLPGLYSGEPTLDWPFPPPIFKFNKS